MFCLFAFWSILSGLAGCCIDSTDTDTGEASSLQHHHLLLFFMWRGVSPAFHDIHDRDSLAAGGLGETRPSCDNQIQYMELTLTAATCVSLVLGVRVEQHIGGNMLY